MSEQNTDKSMHTQLSRWRAGTRPFAELETVFHLDSAYSSIHKREALCVLSRKGRDCVLESLAFRFFFVPALSPPWPRRLVTFWWWLDSFPCYHLHPSPSPLGATLGSRCLSARITSASFFSSSLRHPRPILVFALFPQASSWTRLTCACCRHKAPALSELTSVIPT